MSWYYLCNKVYKDNVLVPICIEIKSVIFAFFANVFFKTNLANKRTDIV